MDKNEQIRICDKILSLLKQMQMEAGRMPHQVVGVNTYHYLQGLCRTRLQPMREQLSQLRSVLVAENHMAETPKPDPAPKAPTDPRRPPRKRPQKVAP